ncbi:hypothetical protein [Rhodococcus koreensis]|uniref:hypothetical protein n=1 Tax=Rhodococcus koreensis TaxID=99653 RepID=UPI003670DF01
MSIECECGRTPPADYEYCGCGSPNLGFSSATEVLPPTLHFGSNNDGIQAGNDITVGGNFIVGKTPNDPFEHRTEMHRQVKRRVWLPDNWLSVVGVSLGILVAIVNLKSNQSNYIATIVACAIVALSGFALTINLTLSATRFRPFRFGLPGYALERDPEGQTFLTVPRARCLWCPTERYMRLQPVEGLSELKWVCPANPVQHQIGFDFTQLPSLDSA